MEGEGVWGEEFLTAPVETHETKQRTLCFLMAEPVRKTSIWALEIDVAPKRIEVKAQKA